MSLPTFAADPLMGNATVVVADFSFCVCRTTIQLCCCRVGLSAGWWKRIGDCCLLVVCWLHPHANRLLCSNPINPFPHTCCCTPTQSTCLTHLPPVTGSRRRWLLLYLNPINLCCSHTPAVVPKPNAGAWRCGGGRQMRRSPPDPNPNPPVLTHLPPVTHGAGAWRCGVCHQTSRRWPGCCS